MSYSKDGMIGVGVAIACFVGFEAHAGWSPAAQRQEQVDACAPQLPEQVTYSPTLPDGCESFEDEMKMIGDMGYELYSHGAFISRFTPGEHYNAGRVLVYGAGSIAIGAATGAVNSIVGSINESETPGNTPVPRRSRFGGRIVLSRRRRKDEVKIDFSNILDSSENYEKLVVIAEMQKY